MRLGFLTKIALALILGTFLGLLATDRLVKRGFAFEAVAAGSWITWPRAASSEADPYMRAYRARFGLLPLDPAQGAQFFADRDRAGARLDGRCRYRLSGAVPASRYWTLTITRPDGTLAETAAERWSLTSAELARQSGSDALATLSAQAEPGNWLPTPAQGRFRLTLTLYDAPISAAVASLSPEALPLITRIGCA